MFQGEQRRLGLLRAFAGASELALLAGKLRLDDSFGYRVLVEPDEKQVGSRSCAGTKPAEPPAAGVARPAA